MSTTSKTRTDEVDARPGRSVPRSVSEQVVAAALFAGATIAVAVIGSFATSAGQDWYDELEEPVFAPPGGVISIVWTVLYVLIAVAGWLGWRSTRSSLPTVAWSVQMALNLAWSSVFFGLESPLGGLVVIVALAVAIAVTGLLLWRVDRLAGVLFVPYLLWVLFATALNVGIGVLNSWT